MATTDKRLDPEAWGATTATSVIIQNAVLPLLNQDRTTCVSSLLYGARATLHTQDGEWSLLAGAHDDYLGWAKNAEFMDAAEGQSAHVHALCTHLYSQADMKSLPLGWLPMGASLTALGKQNDFTQTPQGYVYTPHLSGEQDAAGYAKLFLETPYLWGGGSAMGIDCSGLTQRAYAMIGKAIPRDTDQQEAALQAITRDEAKRGDLVYWKGHVGILDDENTMIHATAFKMKTIVEDLNEAIERIGEPTSFRRVT